MGTVKPLSLAPILLGALNSDSAPHRRTGFIFLCGYQAHGTVNSGRRPPASPGLVSGKIQLVPGE